MLHNNLRMPHIMNYQPRESAGIAKLTIEQIEGQGYTVISIDGNKWATMAMNAPSAKEEYLRSVLNPHNVER